MDLVPICHHPSVKFNKKVNTGNFDFYFSKQTFELLWLTIGEGLESMVVTKKYKISAYSFPNYPARSKWSVK